MQHQYCPYCQTPCANPQFNGQQTVYQCRNQGCPVMTFAAQTIRALNPNTQAEPGTPCHGCQKPLSDGGGIGPTHCHNKHCSEFDDMSNW